VRRKFTTTFDSLTTDFDWRRFRELVVLIVSCGACMHCAVTESGSQYTGNNQTLFTKLCRDILLGLRVNVQVNCCMDILVN